MSNKITEQYFTLGDFSQRADEVLAQVTSTTGFVVEKEIFRRTIYDKNKVESLIYNGTFQGKPAVLKLQGLKPEVEEATIITEFPNFNESKRVRPPFLYAHEAWTEERGYGYMITEYVEAPKIFKMPFATAQEMAVFAEFYQEYRNRTFPHRFPWMQVDTDDSIEFSVFRVDHWRKISENKGRLTVSDYAPQLARFYPLAVKHMRFIPIVFCHGHLTANDIHCLPDNLFVVHSNLFWSYRPQWYDLAFNIWACLLHIRDTNYTIEQLLAYVESWIGSYHKIPVVQEDKDFERKMTIMLLERTMGSILVDLGANDTFALEENKPYFHHLLDLHQKFFDHLAQKLENA